MKINFDTNLKSLSGENLKAGPNGDATLGVICVESLMGILECDRNISGAEKLKRYKLAQKLYGGGEIDLTPEEASLLKERVGLCWGPNVVGPAYALLDG